MEPTSEQELKQLLEEGKITEEEYQQLKEAVRGRKPNEDIKLNTMSDGEFKLRKKMLIYGLTCSVVGLPIGLILELPYVWSLSIAGIVIGAIKMKKYRIIK